MHRPRPRTLPRLARPIKAPHPASTKARSQASSTDLASPLWEGTTRCWLRPRQRHPRAARRCIGFELTGAAPISRDRNRSSWGHHTPLDGVGRRAARRGSAGAEARTMGALRRRGRSTAAGAQRCCARPRPHRGQGRLPHAAAPKPRRSQMAQRRHPRIPHQSRRIRVAAWVRTASRSPPDLRFRRSTTRSPHGSRINAQGARRGLLVAGAHHDHLPTTTASALHMGSQYGCSVRRQRQRATRRAPDDGRPAPPLCHVPPRGSRDAPRSPGIPRRDAAGRRARPPAATRRRPGPGQPPMPRSSPQFDMLRVLPGWARPPRHRPSPGGRRGGATTRARCRSRPAPPKGQLRRTEDFDVIFAARWTRASDGGDAKGRRRRRAGVDAAGKPGHRRRQGRRKRGRRHRGARPPPTRGGRPPARRRGELARRARTHRGAARRWLTAGAARRTSRAHVGRVRRRGSAAEAANANRAAGKPR